MPTTQKYREESQFRASNDLTKLYEWSQKWQMELIADKCHVIKFGKSGMRPDWEYKLGNKRLQECKKEKFWG